MVIFVTKYGDICNKTWKMQNNKSEEQQNVHFCRHLLASSHKSMLRGGWWGFHWRLCCYVAYCVRLNIFILCQFRYSWSIQKYIGTMTVSCLKKNKWAHVFLILKCSFLTSHKLSHKGHLNLFRAKFITFQWFTNRFYSPRYTKQFPGPVGSSVCYSLLFLPAK